MTSTSVVTVTYGGESRQIALFSGLEAGELSDVLCSTFFLKSGSIAGFQVDDLLIPISLACKLPNQLPAKPLQILVLDKPTEYIPTPPTDNDYNNVMPPAPPSIEDTTEMETSMESNATSDTSEEAIATINEILRFVQGLRIKKILTKAQADALEEKIFENPQLVLAAYSVASAAGDVKYFSEMCREIATACLDDDGKRTISAQETMLAVLNQLTTIDESQIVYLRHMICIRSHQIASVYDEFVENRGDVNVMGMRLLALAHPDNNYDKDDKDNEDSEESNDSSSEEDEDEDDDEDYESEVDDSAAAIAPSEMSNTSDNYELVLSSIISSWLRAGEISGAEASILLEMIQSSNDYVMAAYELYQHDGNLSELKDTLLRCAFIEMKRIASSHEEAYASKNIKPRTSQSNVDVDGKFKVEEFLETEYKTLTELLASCGMYNVWSGTVPSEFITICFSAALGKIFSIGQAKALCDLYQASYDLILGAWEVYTVQKSQQDLVDTLIRIVRDLDFDDKGNVMSMDNNDNSAADTSKYTTSSNTTESNSVNVAAMDEAMASRRAESDTRREALSAVTKAKQDLVRHSLDMMVKQEMCTQEGADSLFERATKGDQLVDAAIDAYATDRDVVEFLDTLSILANNTQEEIDALLRSGAARMEAEANEGTTDNGTSTTNDENSSDEDVSEDDDVEDDESDEDDALTQCQLDLLAAVAQLSKEGRIDRDMKLGIVSLISVNDERMVSAHKVYQEFKDPEDFKDTILRIGRANSSYYKQVESARNGTTENKANDDEEEEKSESESESDDDDDDDDEDDPTSDMLLSDKDMGSIIDTMTSAGHLNDLQQRYLKILVSKKDPAVINVFRIYEHNKDVMQMMQGLRDAGMVHSLSPTMEDDNDDYDDDSDSDEVDITETPLNEDDRETIEARFLSIVQSMELSNLETAALRLAISRDNPNVRSCLESFRLTRNEDALMAELKSIARSTIDSTLAEAGYELEESSKSNNAAMNGVNDEESDEDSEDESSDDDSEVEEEEDNNNNGASNGTTKSASRGDSGGILSPVARNQMYPILIMELVKESILNADEGSKLVQLFKKDDPVIGAAMDVYEVEGDMAELVDTLKRTANIQGQMV